MQTAVTVYCDGVHGRGIPESPLPTTALPFPLCLENPCLCSGRRPWSFYTPESWSLTQEERLEGAFQGTPVSVGSQEAFPVSPMALTAAEAATPGPFTDEGTNEEAGSGRVRI